MSLRLALEEQRDEGRAEGIAEGMAIAIRNLIKNMGLTARQAMEALGIPAEEQPKYLEQINDPAAVPQPE